MTIWSNPNKPSKYANLGYKDLKLKVRFHKRVIGILDGLPADIIVDPKVQDADSWEQFVSEIARHAMSDLATILHKRPKRWQERYAQVIIPWATKTLYSGVHPDYIPVVDMDLVKITLDSGNYDPVCQRLDRRWWTITDKASDVTRMALEDWFFRNHKLRVERQAAELAY